MANEMLIKLIRDRMKDKRLSYRRAAEEIGITHTTLRSIASGNGARVENLRLIANWLDIDLTLAMGMLNKDPVADKVAALMKTDPRLGKVLTEMIKDYEEGNLSREDVEDIMNYAEYRMQRPIKR